ncbi:DUF1553 domain-containing protein [Rosistilla oblonga]|uniref:DUF1553 domain-containing protein n=1 Tax=Rosistilla oblonga TaxID=2527990 RepID=UPI003A9777E2
MRGLSKLRLSIRLVAAAVPIAFLAVTFVLSAWNVSPLRADEVSSAPSDGFENSIRPLFITHCIECHGPRKAESGLRFDTRDTLLQGGDGGPAISLEKPHESLILQALRHQDGLEMPPDKPLPEAEIAAVEAWIRAGAPWPEGVVLGGTGTSLRGGAITDQERAFWSFQPIRDPQPPTVVDPPGLSEIDRFVMRKLKEMDLKPSPPASRRDWIRRATLDLTGLPPTPKQVQSFLDDRSETAEADRIEQLLASSAYGERWGRHWLDVVRYADTAGETADYPTPLSYKYRNWVIDALNADLPYDQFVMQQIAGDVMANAMLAGSDPDSLDADQLRRYSKLLTATGFIAISRRFGFDVENYHHLTIQDTIDVLGQATLGLTLGCARCHDHKFDPVNIEDYYAWYGIFASTKYSFPGSEEKRRPYDLVPDVPPAVLAQRQREIDLQMASIESQQQPVAEQLTQLNAQIQQASGTSQFFGFEEFELGKPPSQPYLALGSATITAASQSPFANVFRYGDRGIAFPSDTQNNAFGMTLVEAFNAESTPRIEYSVDFRNTSIANQGQGAYRFYVGHGPGTSAAIELAANATTFFVKDGAQYRPIADLKMGQWYNVHVVLDLRSQRFEGTLTSGSETSTFSVQSFTSNWDGIVDYTFVDRYGPGSGETPAHEIDNLIVSATPLASNSPLAVEKALPADAAIDLPRMFQQRRELQAIAEALQQQRDRLAVGPVAAEDQIYGAMEQSTAVNCRVQLRGEPTRLGVEVRRRNLEIFGGETVHSDAGSGRLQLARWIVSDKNPLFARVMVNRIWQQHFGRGLVGTENDFGTRGELPTHPELLDWLASRFRDSGYSIKAMHRLIMTSDAYRRSSGFDSDASKVDPESRLLWRFNLRQLSAEEIRDAMLQASGNLDPSRGMAHPFPAVESWGFSQHNPFYALYESNRRSVYLMQQRLKRHPFLGLFDGADTNVSTARREMTTVPTQALFLMNSEFVHEQSAAFADRVLGEFDNDAARIDRAHWIALSRPATASEQDEAVRFLNAYRVAVSTSSMPLDVADRTAWQAYLRTLISRNEFLYVD